MSVHRTQARVDNELIYDRQRFLGDIDEATMVDLAVGDTAVEAGTVDAAILTVNLPNVAKARGKIYTISGTNANAGEIHVVLSGTTVTTVENSTDGFVCMLFYSDGRHWVTGGGDIDLIQQITACGTCSASVNMSASVSAYEFIVIDAGTGGIPSAAGIAVDGVCYLAPDTGGEPGLFHPTGCQALVTLATAAAFSPGDYVYTDASGHAIDIAQLAAGSFFQPVGYAVTAAGVDKTGTDTHVEVYLFPADMLGTGNFIEPVEGTDQL